ncbi:ABC transporter permease [Niallia endozanthoxylica]|uniref:ABC transporter permease n=1 Tax=Niallia endozanthoxylica TaxID=2036016 RepID=A0A5J5HQS0_9BACI|nr:ABC transporter permease [Niallia endozanthoxylica]KAA9021787.1 ABC transporter permease [Niallia endozanthoxylica]
MRTIALVKRICLEMFRDKRTLALLFVAPLLILTLMYLLFNGGTVEPKLGVVNVEQGLIKELKNADIITKEYVEVSDVTDLIVEEELDGLLQKENQQFTLTLLNGDPSIAKSLQVKVSQNLSAYAQSSLMNQSTAKITLPKVNIETNYVYGSNDTVFFDVLSPVLIGFFVFFFVFLISGIGLLKERTTGTLERLMSTPIRRGEIVSAYLIGFGMFAVIQTVIVVFYSINVLDIVLMGSIWNVILINLLLALVALSLGILLSTFAATEFQMVQFIPIAIIPQIFFSGILPLEGMVDWLQWIGKIMPLYYAADALKAVMYKGLGIGDIMGDLLALVVFALIFIILNIFALKRYRKL